MNLSQQLFQKQINKNLAYQTTYTTYANPFHPLWETAADRANHTRAMIPNGGNIDYFKGDVYNKRSDNMKLNRKAAMLNFDSFKPRKVIPGDVSFNVTNVNANSQSSIAAQNIYMAYGVSALIAVVLLATLI